MKEPRRIRVILADDHTLVRAGVRRILEAQPRISVVAEVSDGEAALRAAREGAADVLVLDLGMPGCDGFEVLRRLRDGRGEMKVLVLTMHSSPEYVARAVQEGADGYLLKDSAVQDLVAAIDTVAAGGVYLSPAVRESLGARLSGAGASGRPIDRLTEREREILRIVAEGLSSKEIAGRLGISVRTVETHRANLMRKLELHSVAQLTRFALVEGLLERP